MGRKLLFLNSLSNISGFEPRCLACTICSSLNQWLWLRNVGHWLGRCRSPPEPWEKWDLVIPRSHGTEMGRGLVLPRKPQMLLLDEGEMSADQPTGLHAGHQTCCIFYLRPCSLAHNVLSIWMASPLPTPVKFIFFLQVLPEMLPCFSRLACGHSFS